MLSALALTSCSATVVSRPCPRVTEIPADVQSAAAAEMPRAPNLAAIVRATAPDRAFNRAICPEEYR